MVDEFTKRHLSAWVDHYFIDPDEADEFIVWALREVDDDPTLLDLSWPTIYAQYERETLRAGNLHLGGIS